MTYTQKLIDARGYGNAEKQLKKDGNWDEWAGLPVKTWRVSSIVTSVYDSDIEARSREEAVMKMNDYVENNLADPLSYEVDAIEAEEIKE